MSYVPKLNDYVRWNKPTGVSVEGWIYFESNDYVTIEIGTKDKCEDNIQHCPIHKKTHTLVVCYSNYWNQLEYVKYRKAK